MEGLAGPCSPLQALGKAVRASLLVLASWCISTVTRIYSLNTFSPFVVHSNVLNIGLLRASSRRLQVS